MKSDEAIAAVHKAGLRVVRLTEQDSGTWLCDLAASVTTPLQKWKHGRGTTAAEAIGKALGRRAKPKTPETEFEDLLG